MTRHLPDALLLDLDGTLVDSEHIHQEAYRAFFAERGWVVEDLTVFTGRRAQDVFATTPGPWTGADPHELAAAVVARTPEDATPEPVAGARDLVHAAAGRGVPVAVVTSAGPQWAELSLNEVLEVADKVTVVVTARDVVNGKPDPTGFALACERLGVDPSGCVAVEDSPAGVTAALAAGVRDVYGLATTHPESELVEGGAVAVYQDLHALASDLGLS
jgi:mannitol-1-/sugar-/sorbitol-6-phosphatase